MSYSIKKLPAEPIVILTANADAASQSDLETVYEQLKTILDQSTEALTIIQDVQQLPNADLDAIMRSASASVDFHKHPHMGTSIMVTTSTIYKMAAQGLDSNFFANQKVMIFDSMEAALAYARKNRA